MSTDYIQTGTENRIFPVSFSLAGIFQERKYDSRKPAAWHIQKSGSRFYFYYGCTSYVSCMYIRFNQSYPIFTNK